MRNCRWIVALALALSMGCPSWAQVLGQDVYLGAPATLDVGEVEAAAQGSWIGVQPLPAKVRPEEAPATFPLDGKVDVGTTLRVRAYPWGPVVGGLKDGAGVKILGLAGEFFRIAYQGRVAFVHRHYVSASGFPSRKATLEYPPGCEAGGHLPLPGASRQPASSTPARPAPAGASPAPVARGNTVGKRQGDGTPAGAVAWGLDQTASGTRKGVNSNNGQSSRNRSAWNGYCLAFVATAYGRKIKDLAASTAYNAYRNCKRSGRPFSKSKNPPAGAVYFSGPTARNRAGHTFIATGERAPDGDPYILTTTGYGGFAGIQRMTLSKMLSMLGGEYLGWTPMP